ncbi:MAG: hypothetical protein ACT4QC_19170 [Planctomycetaceae bacterium]
MLVILLALAVVGGGAVVWRQSYSQDREQPIDLIVETVKRGSLEISITERGSLESANNTVLSCKVEGEAGTGIIMIVDEGSSVKEGDILVELDSSRLRNDKIAQEIVVTQAQSAMDQAEKNVEIQKTQNDSDIAAAKLKLELAELDLEKYNDGDYEQEKKGIEGEISLAEEDLIRANEKYVFTQRLIKKGYATQTELEADRIATKKAENTLNVAIEKKRVLEEYAKKRQQAELTANAKEFVREVERAELKAQAALDQYESDFKAKKLTYEVEKERLQKLLTQIVQCTIRAPCDGIVVYANTRSGFRGSSEPLIFEGAKVKERQQIIQLPDVTQMQVNARIHESKIDMVRESLPATIRVDGKPGEVFHGMVSMVSLVSASGNWPNMNLKEYVTYIKLTDEIEKVSKLKPGMTTEVEILIDRLSSVLQAPLQSFVERGGRHFAWITSGKEFVRREVKLGKASEAMQQIVEDESLYAKDQGLKEGDKVVLNPRTVLPKLVVALEEEVPALVEAPPLRGPWPAGAAPGATAPGARPAGGSPGAGGGGPGGPGMAGGPAGEPRGGGRPGGGFGDPAERFAQMDKNGDGKLTDDEIPEQARNFINVGRLDTNKNGAIDKEEWLKSMEEMRQRMSGGGGGGPAGAGGPPGAGGGHRNSPQTSKTGTRSTTWVPASTSPPGAPSAICSSRHSGPTKAAFSSRPCVGFRSNFPRVTSWPSWGPRAAAKARC